MRVKNAGVILVVPLTIATLLFGSCGDGHHYSLKMVSPLAADADNPPVLTPVITVTRSEPWDKIEFGQLTLSNNIWGAPEDERLTSRIYTDQDRSFGWQWERNEAKPRPGENLTKPIYPSVRIGGSPWEPSMTQYFPVKLRDIKSFKFELAYNYPVAPTGIFNLAYDMFLTDTPQPCSDPVRKAEVMIWLQHTFPQPPEAYRGDVTDGINTYEYYSMPLSNWQYYSFVIKEQPPSNPHFVIDAKRLLDHLGLDRDWYIPGVELGNEVVSGSGKIEISKFKLNLNNSDF
jgi:hypothetical protein